MNPSQTKHRGGFFYCLNTALLIGGSLVFGGSIFLWAPIIEAKTLVIADFNSGGDPLNINSGGTISTTDTSITTGTYQPHTSSLPAKGNRGFSYKVQHLNTSDAYLVIGFTPVDLRGYRTLSFWIRGDSGGEHFKLDLRRQTSPTEPSFRPNVKEFMVGGVTTQWKKVNVPLKAIMKDLTTESYEAFSDVNGIILNFTDNTPGETFYIDDIVFHSESGNVMIDNFDDGSSPMAFGYSPFDFVNGGTGASFTTSYDAGNAVGGSGNAYKIVWNAGTALPTSALTAIEIDTRSFSVAIGTVGVDVFTCDTLSFDLKGEASASGKFIGIGLSDDFGTEKIHPSTVTITTSYQTVTRTMSDFAVNKDSVSVFEVWTINPTAASGPPINASSNMTFYMDNIRFLDTSTPTAPASLLKSGSALASGMQIASTDTFAVTAAAEATDPTIERVRFEHDNMSGGASWYSIGFDTDTTDTSYSAVWENFSSLSPGNTYQFRAAVEDIAGNEGRVTVSSVTLPLVNSATGFAVTVTSSTSIVWSWFDASGNEDGFKVFSTSGGQVSPNLAANATFWAETGLTPNLRFGRFVRPFKGAAVYPLTEGATRYTLSSAVVAVATQATTGATITITWSSGTGTSSQFVVQRASDAAGVPGSFAALATVTANSFSYQDTVLQRNTTFWYRVVAFNGDFIAAAPSPVIAARSIGGPEIIHTPITAVSVLGSSATISATFSSSFSFTSISLMYRKKGDGFFTQTTFLPGLNQATEDQGSVRYTGSAVIPAAFIQDSLSVSGFEYIIAATDTVSASAFPSSGVQSVTVSRIVVAPPVGSAGGTIAVSDGDPSDGETGLIVPPGALTGDVEISVRTLVRETLQPFNNMAPAAAYDFGPDGLKFSRPITMTLLYFDKNQDGVVDGTGMNETDLKFFWYDGYTWRNLGGTVNASANTVTAQVAHFSTFGLFPAGAPSASDVRPPEKIITPNGDGVNDFAQFGLSGQFEIKILDVQGRPVRTLDSVALWDGRKDNGEFAESGAYVYQVSTSELSEKVTGTIGVAR